MFNYFKKNMNILELYSPAKGKIISLNEVNDKIFSSRMMGEGLAIQLDDEWIIAPCDAQIVVLANTKHAVGLSCSNGAEILIHIGLDTIELNGNGFKPCVNVGDKVKKGEKLIRVDKELLYKKDLDMTTPIIITNSNDFSVEIVNDLEELNLDLTKPIMRIKRLT